MHDSMFESSASPMPNLLSMDQDELLHRGNGSVVPERLASTTPWRIGFPHRVTTSALFLLASLVVLVMYLDHDIGDEPFYVLIAPMLYNFLLIAYYAYKHSIYCGKVYNTPEGISGISYKGFAFAVFLILSIATFELLLCLRVRGASVPLIAVFVPFWCFSFSGSVYLFRKTIEIHFKKE